MRSNRNRIVVSDGTFTCLPLVKICVNNPAPALAAAPMPAPLPPPKIAPIKAPNPAPPPPYSRVRLFAPTPRPLVMATSVSTRNSLPQMSTEKRSRASSGLWTAPPGDIAHHELGASSTRNGDTARAIGNIFAEAGRKQLPARGVFRIDIFVGVNDDLRASWNNARHFAAGRGWALCWVKTIVSMSRRGEL